VGDYDTVARRIVEFTEAGIETFLLQVQPFKREMGLFANEIAPSLRALQGAGAKAFDDRAARA
jgi:alkanesulfonate monooxygenase